MAGHVHLRLLPAEPAGGGVRAMRRFAVVIACAITLALPMAGPGIAAADTWGGCQGNTCTVGIDKIANIILTQDGVRLPFNLSNLNVNVPACWMAPGYSQAPMLSVLASLEQAVKAGGGPPGGLRAVHQSLLAV